MTTDTRPTQRIIHTCNQCKHTYAYDYEIFIKQTHAGRFVRLVRFTENMAVESSQDGFRCPRCNSMRIQSSTVVGHYSERHVCDGQCMNAKGPNCDCSCGGANHGSAYLQ